MSKLATIRDLINAKAHRGVAGDFGCEGHEETAEILSLMSQALKSQGFGTVGGSSVMSNEAYQSDNMAVHDIANSMYTSFSTIFNDSSAVNLRGSMESMVGGDLEAVKTGSKKVSTEGLRILEQSQESAIMAAIAASDPANFLRRTSNEAMPAEAIGFSNLAGGEFHHGRMQEYDAAMESFDNTNIRNTMMYSFSYGFKATRQDAFGEAFFPTSTLSPDVATVTISIDLLSVMNDISHGLTGKIAYQFDRKTLISALVYPTILQNDTTKIHPIVRDENKEFFVDEAKVPYQDLKLETSMGDEDHKTTWLATGKEGALLQLGTPDYLIGAGPLNFTDNLDGMVALTDLLLEIDLGSKKEYVPLSSLNLIPESTFTPPVQGNDRELQLNFNNRFVTITPDTKTITGAKLETAASQNNFTVRLHVTASGSVNLESSLINVTGAYMGVTSVFNNKGDAIPTDKGVGQTVKQAFGKVNVIGYKVDARRINANRRERGQLLDITRERMVYGMPILAPISIARPVSEPTSHDAARIDALVAATYVRCSNAAVATLLQADEQLRNLPPQPDPEFVYNSKILGAARYFIKPYYNVKDLDVSQQVNSLRSADRIADVGAVLLNMIREMVFDAYLQSNYKAAADALTGTAAGSNSAKPKVIIGTDPKIAAYLQLIGDTRNLGDQFEYEVVSTPNIDMRGKMFIVFGKNGSNANDIANPLHFGNMFWRPEMTTVLQVTRRGATGREMTVQPSFRHVIHCPILMRINIKGLTESIVEGQPIKVAAQGNP